MFAKNKVTQSMLDAVNSVLVEDEKKRLINDADIDETGFHKAAHAAKKSGQSHFEFQGKKYPVTAKSHKEAIEMDEASLKIPTATGTKVLGGSGYGSKKAHDAQHKNPFEKGPSKKDLKGIKAPSKKELKHVGENTFAAKLLNHITENKASGATETFTDNNLGEEDMTDKQMKKREKIVLSMKKGEAGFKQRYGKNWKNVMYATATKQAMKAEASDTWNGSYDFILNEKEEVELDEGDAQYKKTTPTKPMSDVVDRKKTVKDLMKGPKYFGTGKMKKEEVEETEALVENFNIINEVSVGAKIRAYANHARDAWEHGDMGNDDESEHHSNRAEKIMAHIEKHHGPEAAKHADKLANSMTFGRHNIGSKTSPGKDSLSDGLRRSSDTPSLTKSGKIPKGTQKSMRNPMWKRKITGPKGHLPEEVELNEDNLDSIAKKHDMEFKRTTYGAGMKHKTKGEVSINRYGEWHHYPSGSKSSKAHGNSEGNFSSLDKHLSSLKEEVELDEKNDSHNYAAHYEDPKTGEWTGMKLMTAKDDQDAIKQAHANCEDGCRLSKVERHMTVKEAVDIKTDKSAHKITTDMLRGREPGGKLNSFKNFKVNLTVAGGEDIPKEMDKGEDTKEKQKITTNPGPVDIKLDDKYGNPTPQSHFSTQEKITKEEVELTEGSLELFLSQKGIEMKNLSYGSKIAYSKSNEFKKWKQNHQMEETDPPFDKPYKKVDKDVVTDKSGAKHTPHSRARDLARNAMKKLKGETMMGKISN